jgi:hypothetical protein
MTPRALLWTGLGLLGVSLLLVLGLVSGPPAAAGALLGVRAWFVQVLTLVGAGLVVSAAALLSLARARQAPVVEPSIDHYS